MLGCLNRFLDGVDPSNYPKVGVIGIAGAVINNTVEAVNLAHWPKTDGDAIAKELKMQTFTLINDFVAAGYGATRLQKKDY